jgi:hypothetical protein
MVNIGVQIRPLESASIFSSRTFVGRFRIDQPLSRALAGLWSYFALAEKPEIVLVQGNKKG